MENNWEVFKQKKTKLLEKELEVFIGKLERIRSNRISLEAIRSLTINYQGERKPLKSVASLRISPNHELVIHAFEPKTIPLIKKVILDEQSGYKFERNTSDEIYFTLTTITTQIKDNLIKAAKSITLEGEKNFRLIHQDLKKWLKKEPGLSQDQKKTYEKQADKLVKDYQEKLVAAEGKKIRELSS